MNQTIIDAKNKIKIPGVCGHMISVGNVVMNIENKRIIHRFTILDHFETRVDGILGSDFLTKNSACIDYARRTIEFYYQN